jgi:hypothetical protein
MHRKHADLNTMFCLNVAAGMLRHTPHIETAVRRAMLRFVTERRQSARARATAGCRNTNSCPVARAGGRHH